MEGFVLFPYENCTNEAHNICGNHLAFSFLLNVGQSELLECSHIFKKLILIYISKKNKSLTIAARITYLIYMISMHFHIKIVQTLLSMQNMWNVITFHCLPSSRCWRKKFFLHPLKQGQQILNSLGLKTLHYTKLTLLILC
jgi:hypothetical protein